MGFSVLILLILALLFVNTIARPLLSAATSRFSWCFGLFRGNGCCSETTRRQNKSIAGIRVRTKDLSVNICEMVAYG